MAVSDWSEDADLNVSIDGINIAEGCPPSNVNNALRAIMANVKDMLTEVGGDISDAVASFSNTYFPQGCRMIFQQSAAPTGWTKEAGSSFNNVALRLVTGSVSSRTACKSFTACMASGRASVAVAQGGTVGGTVLTAAMLPKMSGMLDNVLTGINPDCSGIVSRVSQGSMRQWHLGDSWEVYGTDVYFSFGSGAPHAHSFKGSSHSHTLDLDVNYVDCIVATKRA